MISAPTGMGTNEWQALADSGILRQLLGLPPLPPKAEPAPDDAAEPAPEPKPAEPGR
jgi:hypothetical protein